jgi:hypothetical protein
MTVTHYIAHFTDENGGELVGEVYWDKLYQRQLRVCICPRIAVSLLDYPIWEDFGEFGSRDRQKMLAVVEKMKAEAFRRKLKLVSERETEFAPKS